MLLGPFGDLFNINKVCFLYMFYVSAAAAAALSAKANMNIANIVCDLQCALVCVCVCAACCDLCYFHLSMSSLTLAA